MGGEKLCAVSAETHNYIRPWKTGGRGKPTSFHWSSGRKKKKKKERRASLSSFPQPLASEEESHFGKNQSKNQNKTKDQIKWWFSIDVHTDIAQGTAGTQRPDTSVDIG